MFLSLLQRESSVPRSLPCTLGLYSSQSNQRDGTWFTVDEIRDSARFAAVLRELHGEVQHDAAIGTVCVADE